MRTLIALALLCAPAVAALVPKELRKAPPVIQQTEAEKQQTESENQQILEIRRHFWFNDPPSHLTPERIHGGIL